MRVKIYGSPNFTPNDLPGGVVLERGSMANVWAGCFGYTTDVNGNRVFGCGMDDVAWRTRTEWSKGGYFCSCFPQDLCRDSFPLVYMQDGSPGTGWDTFTNYNAASNKWLLMRIGLGDITNEASISYIRLWMSGKCPSKTTNWVRPYYWVVGTNGDPTCNVSPGDGSDKGWNVATGSQPGYFILGQGTATVPQATVKLTAIKGGYPMTGRTIRNTAFGVRFGTATYDSYVEGEKVAPAPHAPGLVEFQINELAIEVGFSLSLYDITTDSCTPTSTTLDVFGTINPHGDTGGTNFFEYGLTNQLGTATPEVPSPGTGLTYQSTAHITGLTTNKVYYFRAVAKDSTGTLHYGEIKNCYTQSGCTVHTSLLGA